MNRRVVSILLVALLVLLDVTSAFAQQDDPPPPQYYVKLDHTGCEDGSMDCPYNTLLEAIDAGKREVCEGRTFEVYEWNRDTKKYERRDTYAGKKPVPPTGLPIAQSLLIVLIALGGIVLLVLALRLRNRKAR